MSGEHDSKVLTIDQVRDQQRQKHEETSSDPYTYNFDADMQKAAERRRKQAEDRARRNAAVVRGLRNPSGGK